MGRPFKNPDIDPSRIRELLDYDPETGVLTWRFRAVKHQDDWVGKTWNSQHALMPAGCLTPYGYILVGITVDGHPEMKLLAHRVAWALHYGEWPDSHLDHINRVRTDNRIANLRLATVTQNLQNSKIRRDNRSGVKGVSYQKARGKWRARLNVDGEQVFYGYYATKEEAVIAREEAELRWLGEFRPVHDAA